MSPLAQVRSNTNEILIASEQIRNKFQFCMENISTNEKSYISFLDILQDKHCQKYFKL